MLKSILKKRQYIPRKSKNKMIKRKVHFNEEKNEIQKYLLTDFERYCKQICWYRIELSIKDKLIKGELIKD